MRNKGFTLIELLIVIAIIGLLASIVLVSLNSARAKSRNAKRNADIQQLRTAFNMGADSNDGTFVSSNNSWVCVSKSCVLSWSGYTANAAVDAFFSPYIPTKPDDPAASSRARGGYLYNNNWAGGTGVDGTFTAGTYFTWTLEATNLTTGVCGPGRIITSSSYIQCLLKLN